MKWLKIFTKLVAFGLFSVILALVGFYFYIEDQLPSEEAIRDVTFQTPMKIYTREGELMSQFGEKRRTPLTFEQIPPQLIDAVIATEDARFYDHFGFDPVGVAAAAFEAIVLRKRTRGASTITQQFAKNEFLTFDRTVLRKLKELYIAIHLEQLLTKKEIITLYFNKIFFGNRAYGVGAAAQVYYGKAINELTLPQLALLAGLPKAPSSYNPIRNPEKAKHRRNVVLSRMLAEKKIDQATFNEAKQAPITAKLHGADITAHAPYVAEEVRKKMVEMYGKEVAYTQGFKVFTTVSADAQKAAQNAVKNNIHAYDERHGYRGPEQYLWQEAELDSTSITSSAWDIDKIQQHLDTLSNYGDLIPAVVTNVMDNEIFVMLKSGELELIDWSNLNWAREYISDTKQGDAPKTASDILNNGAQIWLRPTGNNNYRLSQIPKVSGSLIALNPQNGDVLSLVGGYQYQYNQFNRITQAERQVGSNIKPFIYSAGLDKGFTLSSLINDAPINKWDKKLGTAWRPENSPPTYDGPTRVRRGLAQSKNVMSVRLMRSLGIDNTVDYLSRFGFPVKNLHRNESLSLGSASLSPMTLVTGMSAFANGGYLIQPNLIDKVEDANGDIAYQPTKLVVGHEKEPLENEMAAPQVISSNNAFLIAESMTSTIWGGGDWGKGNGWNGTAWRAQQLKRKDLSGKTGTTNDAVDTWFTGFNSSVIATSWVGFDDPGRPLGRTKYNTNLDKKQVYGGESGAKTALPAWIEYMSHVLPAIKPTYREIPEGIVSVRIDRETGLLTRKTDYTTRFEYFISGTEPQKYVENDQPLELRAKQDVMEEDEIF